MKKGLKRAVKARRAWPINPGTRIKEDGRLYNRKKQKKAFFDLTRKVRGEEPTEGK